MISALMPASIGHACWALLAHLVAPAARSLCLGCFAALLVGALRVKSASARLAIWRAVLYAALAMPLLGVILPPLSFKLPAAVARLIRHTAIVVNAPRPNAQTFEAGPSAAANFPTASSRAPHEIPSPRSNSDVDPLSSQRNSRSSAARVDNVTTAKAASAVSESSSSLISAAIDRASLSWIVSFAAIYISITLVFLGRLVLGIVLSRRLIRAARPMPDSGAAALLSHHGRHRRLTVPPCLAESELISVPLTLGILRPVILLPAGWREWNPAALYAVIAHECSHVIRRDPLTQRLSLLHCAIFWFSPLSWWLHRRLAGAAEEASDEAALLSGADRAQYAETLLGFFVALQRTPRRVNWQGVSMAKAGQAEKRVDRILAWKGNVSMRLNKFWATSLLLLGVPVALFAAAARPSIADARNQTLESAPAIAKQAAAANQSLSAPPTLRIAAPRPQAPAIAPPAPEPAPFPAPPAVPPSVALAPDFMVLPHITLQLPHALSNEQIQKIYSDVTNAIPHAEQLRAEVEKAFELQAKEPQDQHIFQVANDPRWMKWAAFDGGFAGRFVIVSGDTPIFMSGDSEDVQHATSLRGKIKGDFIWFQRDEKSYVIRDEGTVDRAKQLFKTEQELYQKQEALGKQQHAIGEQQRELGKKMEEVRVQIPDMSAEMQNLEAQMKVLGAGGTQRQLGELQRQIGELQHRIGEFQFQAGDQQRQIGEQMRELGHQQGELGRQQGEIARQQAEASHQANEQMKQLLDDAITRGTAQPE